MKETGIIRQVDDLGRVVIPREIRRSLGIAEGDAFEILYDENGVTFRKYSLRSPVYDALKTLKTVVSNMQPDKLSCRTEFLQSICELEARLKLEDEEGG